ncbi:MAG: DUF1844 domain-containing protein [Proteobacteria bacterium]|nr:DUF1844 domain-containing protein [Pseudomonadota bacterium]
MSDEHKAEKPSESGERKQGSLKNAQLPQVTFSTFVMSLASSALVHLGEVPEPETGQMQLNLPVAKHTVDILTMLQEKTGNCLDPDEAKLLQGLLYELRMKYVVKTK